MTGNQIQYWALQETKRSNLAKEQETNRTNVRNENIKEDTLTETKRSNLINEGIKRDTLSETKRSNLINEGIKRDDVNSQIERRSIQNNTDIANAVTGGIGSILGGAGRFGKLFI